jgi:DNA recombination protein RmuC
MTTTAIVVAVVALAVGVAIGWLFARARVATGYESQLRSLDAAKAAAESSASEVRRQSDTLRSEVTQARARIEQESNLRAAAEASLAKTEENLQQQRALLDEAQTKLSATFDSIASKALSESNNQFLQLAQSRLATLQADATNQLANKKVEIDGIVNPLNETLKELKAELNRVELSRKEAYGQLTTQVGALNDANRQLRDETGNLVNSLRQPQIRGRWGEMTLRRAIELAGLSPHCDFNEQHRVETEDGVLRPDLVIHMTGNKHIVIDSKVPLHAFMNAADANNEVDRTNALKAHVDLVRKHVRDLSSKSYWRQFERAPEFVILYMPAESFFSAAVREDLALVDDAMQSGVMVTSPTTLITLLKTIALGWRQEEISKNAERISELGGNLYERIQTFLGHMESIRKGLETTNKAYNSAVGSLESRVLPTVRTFRELGVPATEGIAQLEPTEVSLRELRSATPDDDA